MLNHQRVFERISRIRIRCGLNGVALAVLEEVCGGGALRFQKLKPGPVSFCLLSTDQNVALSSCSSAVRLPSVVPPCSLL